MTLRDAIRQPVGAVSAIDRIVAGYRDALGLDKAGAPRPMPVLDVVGLSFDQQYRLRDRMTKELAFAIPCERALAAIAKLSPLVEIGPGTGYWAALLALRGADIVAVGEPDKAESYEQTIGSFFPVKPIGTLGLSYLAVRSGFLCWPPYDDDMAVEVAARIRPGRRLAYIGEGPGGATANDGFFDLLRRGFDLEDVIRIPTHWGLHDSLHIYATKEATTK